MRWLLVLALLLLAGCSDPGATSDAAPRTASEPARTQDVHGFDGTLTGVGVVSPDQVSFTGISSRSQGFQVQEGATKLTAVLVWDVPADLYLDLDGPNGPVAMQNALTGAVDRSITFTTDEVPAGSWSVHAWAQGPAAVSYTITVTVDYDA